jgi:mevalonate kinase
MHNVLVSAPAKVILFGEHSVVYGKPALSTSVDLRTYALLSTTCEEVTLHLLDLSATFAWSLEDIDELRETAGSWFEDTSDSLPAADVKAVNAFLTAYMHAVPHAIPMEISIRSACPVGSGLGSSASFSVCIAATLLLASGKIDVNLAEHREVIN